MRMAQDEHQQVEHVELDLKKQFTDVPERIIVAEVQAGVSAFREARIRTFVPVLVHKRVRDRLRSYASSPAISAHSSR